jgi:hypothetical protein
MPELRAERDEIALFVSSLFRYCDSETFASLRAFDQFNRGTEAEFIRPIRINGSLEPLIDAALKAANDAANADHPVVFAPPICTLTNGRRARTEDLANGLVLSVEIDEGDTQAARHRLEGLLGPATVVMTSGGDWTDPDTGQIHSKLHIHWRLSEPTRDAGDHQRLHSARDMAARLIGADPTGKPVVHALRWPGSWNTKGKPVLARIVQLNESAEINLPDALDALTDAIESAGLAAADLPRSGDPSAPLPLLTAAFATIPNNDEHYDTWIRYGYAAFRAAGSEDGSALWEAWSRKSAKFNASEQDAAWSRIHKAILGSSAPRTIGAGTVFFEAGRHGWRRPDPEPPDDPPGYWDDPLPAQVEGSNVIALKPKRRKAPREGWQSGWQLSETGVPLPNLFNAMVALRGHPPFSGLVRYDEMARAIVLTKQVPNTSPDPTIPRQLHDADALAVQEELQLIGLRRIAKATAQDAIRLYASQCRYHPVLDYLNSLSWDGTQRIRGWLGRYLGVEGCPYSDTVGELFLIALVARQFQPGCKADYMLILEGPQGAMKSSACRVLAGEWFSDSLPDLARGDAVRVSMHLRGKWLIEIAEMSSFSTAESHTLKEFLTQTVEQYTPKYAEFEVKEPRQCLFVGTTNEATYLRDATGGRRFWPAKVGEILLADLAADRDQLLAEAVHHYREGRPWWPSPEFEEEHIAPQQKERFEEDPWQEIIVGWVLEQAITRCTVNDVLKGPLGAAVSRIGTREQRRVSAILRHLGWVGTKSNGKWWFVRPHEWLPG